MDTEIYIQKIRQAYEGEIIGEKLYRKLGVQCDNADNKLKLNAIADLEAKTHGSVGADRR